MLWFYELSAHALVLQKTPYCLDFSLIFIKNKKHYCIYVKQLQGHSFLQFGFYLLVFLKTTLKMFPNGNTIAFLNTYSAFFSVYFKFSIHIKALKYLPDMDHCQLEWQNNIGAT